MDGTEVGDLSVHCYTPCFHGYLICGIISFYVYKKEGATKEEIDRLPKYKFQRTSDVEKVDGEIQESYGGIMTECDTDTPIERVLSQEDAVSYNIWLYDLQFEHFFDVVLENSLTAVEKV